MCAFCVLGLENNEANQTIPSQSLLTMNNTLNTLIATSAVQLDRSDIDILSSGAEREESTCREESLVIIIYY